MKRFRQWLVRIIIGLLIIIMILAAAGTWFVRRPWAETDGTIAAAGLIAPVKVIRDKWGVPHIYAENEHDLFFAQGYVHAQDRLWQMETTRRFGSGKLSEVFGKAAVDSDRFMRTLGLRRNAEKIWAGYDPQSREILEAYAQGVNTYVDTHRDRLPVEFTIFGVNPEAWTPLDSITWGNVISSWLSGNYTLELLRAQMIAQVGEEITSQLFPGPVEGTPIIVPNGVDAYRGLQSARFDALTNVDYWIGLPEQGLGSNNWVVSGSRTATGKPFLANDTHLGLAVPSTWYENDLHGGRFNSAGFSFTGVPLVILGHNDHIAWGTSNLGNDVQDLYLEKLNDLQNPTQYEYQGKWYDLEIIPDTITIKGQEPLKFNILLTQHGPILNADKLATEQPLALRWTLQDGNKLFNAIQGINLATNWNEFHEAVRLWDLPGQNFVYADVEGNIAYQASGKTPIRVDDHLGTIPVPGWTGEYEWQGYVPYDEMPMTLNPPDGYIATANNKITPDDYPYVLARDFYPGFRAQRITDMLKASNEHTREDMQKMHGDVHLLPAEYIRPHLLAAIQPENDVESQAIDRLKNWDFKLDADSVGGAIYQVWFMFIVNNTITDELGSDLSTTYLAGGYQRHSSQVVPLIINLMATPEDKLWDDINTPAVETPTDIIRHSLKDALDFLSQHCGGNMDGWQWGCIHTMTFKHQPMGDVPVLQLLFNTPALRVPGDRFTVNAASFNASKPFTMVHGSSQRLIVDLGNLNNSVAIMTLGASGQVFHPHYMDHLTKWQNVEYNPLLFTQEAAQANAESVLILTPAK